MMRLFPARAGRKPMVLSLLASLALPALAIAQVPPSFTKSFSPDTIGAGSVSTLRFEIVNGDAVPLRNLAFTDDLPPGMTVATPARATSTCSGSLSAPDGGTSIEFSGTGLGASSSCSITVDVTAAALGTLTNISGELVSDAGSSGVATADLVVAADRPGFAKSFSPSTVAFGGRSTLTFTIDNSANASNLFNLTFTDLLPAGMVVASPSNAATTCGGGVITAPGGGGSISYGPALFPDATLAAGATCTVSVDVIGNAVGTLANSAGPLTSIPGTGGPARSSGNANAVLIVNVEQLSLTKAFLGDPVPPGALVALEFTLRNLDRRSEATDITFTDDLDAVLPGLTAVGLPLADPCGAGSQLGGTGTLTLSGGSLGSGEVCAFEVLLQIPEDSPSGSYTNVTSDVLAQVAGASAFGSAATDVLFIAPVPEFSKRFVDDPVGAGGSVELEFTITNTSTVADATGIAFEDVFDTVLPTASVVPAAGFCGAGASATFIPLSGGTTVNPARLLVTGASLAPGATCTFALTLDVAAGSPAGIYPNVTGELTATIDGETVTAEPASDELTVVAGPRLVKEFTGDPVSPGETVNLQFTLTHDELAAGDATAISFSDDLDATLAGLVATGLPATDVCGTGSTLSGEMTLLLSGASLSAGESCSFGVLLQVPETAPAGSHPNTTSSVVATVAGVETVSRPATDDLKIGGLSLAKEFTDDPALPGGTVMLRYTLTNDSPLSDATSILFLDDLDAALAGLAATGLPLTDVCGSGSSLTQAGGLLTFQGGTLDPGESCSFDVGLLLPTDVESGSYFSSTTTFRAVIEGETVVFDNAADRLQVTADLLALSKEFVDDPVAPGETVTLRFTLTNLSATDPVDEISFSDDLEAALQGLVSTSGTLTDVCGAGSQIGGTGLLSFVGGSLAAGAGCSFDVSISVPVAVPLGTRATNVTSVPTGTVGGLEVIGNAATDELRIDFLELEKSFGGSAEAGGTVTLTFTLRNLGQETTSSLAFLDDLDAVLPGLEATGLPAVGFCGENSVVSGTSELTVTGAELLPGGSCTFSVELQLPAGAAPGSYLNVTSELLQGGLPAAAPATATLEVIEVNVDQDGDGVLDEDDVCPGTVIPEGVPTRHLLPLRYALVDDDLDFDTAGGHHGHGGHGPLITFDTTDTGGCSCEQIIDALHLGRGHTKFGCGLGAMLVWVHLVAHDHLPLGPPF